MISTLKIFCDSLSPARRAALGCARPDPRGAVLQACLAGIGTGARGRGSLPRSRDGMGPRLRSLGTGARSSLTERLSPHEKRGPCREIAALERCEAPASRKGGKRKARCAVAALRPPRFFPMKRGLRWKNARAREKTRARGRWCLGESRYGHPGSRTNEVSEAYALAQNDKEEIPHSKKVTRRLGYPTGIRTASPRSHLEVTWRIDL